MAINFGETWWGKAWLGALEKMDHSNRLPRGASYARSGHVEKISIRGNSVTAKVLVHRFITKGTFEDKIDKMISDKKHLAQMTVSTGENWIVNLSDEELRSIFE